MNALWFSEVDDRQKWESAFARVSEKTMSQAWDFGEAKRVEGWQPERFFLSDSDETIALLQVLRRKILKLPVAARINMGPLFIRGKEGRAKDVLEAIRGRWQLLRRGVLLIAPGPGINDDHGEYLVQLGFCRWKAYRWSSSWIDLTSSEEQIRKSLDSKWRNQLKKAESNGLQFCVSNDSRELEWLISNNSKHLEQKGVGGPPAKFLRRLFALAPENFDIYFVTYRGARIAGMVAYRFQDAAHYYIGWNGPEGRSLNAGNYMLWNAVMRLKRTGCIRFDLGGHSLTIRSGFNAFKQGMKGNEYSFPGEFICF